MTVLFHFFPLSKYTLFFIFFTKGLFTAVTFSFIIIPVTPRRVAARRPSPGTKSLILNSRLRLLKC